MTDEGGPSGAPGDDPADAADRSGPDDADAGPGEPNDGTASDADADADASEAASDGDTDGAPDPEALAADLRRLQERVDDLAAEGAERDDVVGLREELAALEDDVEDRTLHRDEIERDLKRYVRKRVRRGHARGWGPYLVLLYGTVMTLGVFYFFQNSAGVAIFAMIVIWLSTLGLYALMLVVNGALSLLAVPGRARDLLGTLRSLKP